MILRKRAARGGQTIKPIMPDGNRSDALSDRSVDEQFAGLHGHLGPTNGLARPQRLLPFSLLFPTRRRCRPSPCRDMLQGEAWALIMDVVVWLRSLGLGKYEAAFRENEIDETVLPGLTHETLKELGVTAVGHRLKLLDAIAALRTDAGGKAPLVDAATTASAPRAPPEDRAERRQVTVMFSDLVGSTALSARMDPEDLREVISAYQKCVAETVQRFGGFVAKYMGDGVLDLLRLSPSP